MSLTAKLAIKHIKNSPRQTAWSIFGIVLAVGMLVAIGGFGAGGAYTLDLLMSEIEGMAGAIDVLSFTLAAVLGLVVAFAGMVVISNTFRVSALERTKQFGILKSVGATKRQIRQTVMYEGLFLLAIGLPLGTVAGFAMQYLALAIKNALVDVSAISETIRFTFEIEPVVLAITLVLSIVVIMLSAWLPARRAAKTPAIDAIKGTDTRKNKREKAKNPRIIGKLFGFEGSLAAKQLKRSRRHFRATVISIITSVVLILASVSLSTHMSRSFDGRIRQLGAPTAGLALGSSYTGATAMDAETLTRINRELRAVLDTTITTTAGTLRRTAENQFVTVLVADRDEYLELIALAGAPDGSNILINVHLEIDAHGNITHINPFTTEVGETISLYQQTVTDGNVGWADTPEYLTIGGIITELPEQFLYLSESVKIIIVPDGDMRFIQWVATPPNPEAFKQLVEGVVTANYTLQEGEIFMVLDFIQALAVVGAVIDFMLAYVQIFSVMLIFLGLTNVISTIVTNIKMRAREFAILTSVGMDKKGLHRMLSLESILSSFRALLLGLPIGYAMAYLMFLVGLESNPIGIVFTPPWLAMAFCAVGVFVITFVIMQASANSLKKGSVIDSIRGVE